MQTLDIKPAAKVDAVVQCPRSKGFTNRALVVAALATGKSVLKNALASEDTEYMIKGLKAFGAKIIAKDDMVTVDGFRGKPRQPHGKIFVGNSGTTARFLMAVAALDGKAVIDGNARMRERPIHDLADALNQLGARAEAKTGCPPVTVMGGKLKGRTVRISGKTSSQHVSALLMVLPYAETDSEVIVDGELTSKPYVDMTIAVMRDFSVAVENSSYRKFAIKKGNYKCREYFVEGDAANASYFFAAAAVTRGRVKVTGINPESAQGEIGFVDILQKMGCTVRKGRNWIEVQGGKLKGIGVDMNSMPDAVQTLAVVAAFATTPTVIKNIANLRIKETDRIAALAAELRKIGCKVDEFSDGLKVIPGRLGAATISTYNDHRMAMSFAVAGLAVKGIKIENPGCVSKTFPDFFGQLERLVL